VLCIWFSFVQLYRQIAFVFKRTDVIFFFCDALYLILFPVFYSYGFCWRIPIGKCKYWYYTVHCFSFFETFLGWSTCLGEVANKNFSEHPLRSYISVFREFLFWFIFHICRPIVHKLFCKHIEFFALQQQLELFCKGQPCVLNEKSFWLKQFINSFSNMGKRTFRWTLKRFYNRDNELSFCTKSLYVQISIFVIPSKAETCVNILNTTYSKCMP